MSETASKYRLVTRADFDGLVCAALLREIDLIEEIIFVHPKDVSAGAVEITDRDITTNVPYDPRCFLAFDHHASEALKHGGNVPGNLVLDSQADSASRVVYRYYGGREKFPNISSQMMVAVDKADAARFTEDEIQHPSGWVLLNFIMDPRTGLGRFHDFRITNFELMMQLIDYCRTHSVEEILALPDVQERVDLFFEHTERAVEQIRNCTRVYGDVAVIDLRDERTIYACSRFMVYALYPKCSVSIHVIWGKAGLNTVLAIGNSVLNRTSPVNIGELCLKYGGGGHEGAGTLQTEHADVDRVLAEVVEQFNAGNDIPMLFSAVECDATDEMEEMETIQEIETFPGFDEPPVTADSGAAMAAAENVIEQALAGTGRSLLATRDDVREIQQRLERIERMLAELVPVATTH